MLGINSSALPLHNQSKKTSESDFYSLNEETAPTLPLPTGGYSHAFSYFRWMETEKNRQHSNTVRITEFSKVTQTNVP